MGGTDETPREFVREQGDALVETTLELLSHDTRNPPGDTRAVVDRLRESFEDLGFATELVAVDSRKPNLVARIPGDRDATFLYEGHLDTVPFDRDAWTVDPLGERRGDRIYGRGATDMKGQVAAMLQTARAYVETGTSPPMTLAFAFVADEETGGDAGLAAVLDEIDLTAAACVVGEPTCDPTRYSITVADRGSVWLTLHARGKAAHGSRPMLGVNAIDRLYDAVTTIRERVGRRALAIEPEMRPIVEESIAYYERTMGAERARDLFDRPTVNLGTVHGGEAINVVPPAATAEVDVRLTAGVDTSEVIADIRACVDDYDGVSVSDLDWSVGSYEPLDSPLVDATVVAVRSVTDQPVYRRSATGGGDAKRLRNAGIPAVEFGLGTETAHAVDEYTTLDALVGNAEIYTRLPAAFVDRGGAGAG